MKQTNFGPNVIFFYAPRLPPTLVRLLRINTLLIYSLRCLASAVLMLTPWVGWDPGWDPGGTPRGARASRARAEARAARAHGRAHARCARARRLRRRQGRGAKGPRGALGFFRWLAEWKGIQRGSAVEIVFTLLLLCLMREFASGESLPLGFNALFVLLWREFASGDHLGASGV